MKEHLKKELLEKAIKERESFTLPEFIKVCREINGLTQFDFQDYGISEQTIYKFENGSRTPSDASLLILSHCLNVPLQAFNLKPPPLQMWVSMILEHPEGYSFHIERLHETIEATTQAIKRGTLKDLPNYQIVGISPTHAGAHEILDRFEYIRQK